MASDKPKVLLVGWDAADWKVIHPLMDQGKMPTVKRLVEGGVMANLATLHPPLSPMLWTSIATGKRASKHGIHGFSEPTPDGNGIRPITNLARKTKAVWNILGQNGLTSNVVGWWPSHPAEPIRGVMVSNHFQQAVGPPEQPWPVAAGAVHPRRLVELLAPLRLNPNELGAEHILPFLPRAAEINQEEDPRLGMCAKILAECTSVHSVATWLMENEPWDFMAVYYDAIDHFCHGFMRYHPPRQEGVPEKDFELYQNVIESAYRYHDMMLARLLQLAGPETTVILMSDHGFHPDHLRPRVLPAEPAGPAMEHRDIGIFVMNGRGIKQDELIHGINLLNITPTILTLFGLAVGEDMDGDPVLEAFIDPPKESTVASWDDLPGDDGRHPPGMQLDPVESQEAIAQLVALGYIEPPGPSRERAISNTVRELRYNLARSYMDSDQHGQAAEILMELFDEWPNEHRFGVQLAMCFRALGRIHDLRAVVEDLATRRKADAMEARKQFKTFQESIRELRKAEAEKEAGHKSADDKDAADTSKKKRLQLSAEQRHEYRQLVSRARYNPYAIDYLWAYVHLAEGNVEEGLACLARSGKIEAHRPGLHLQVGEAYLQLKKGKNAQESFLAAIDIDPESPHAHLGLARSYLQMRRNRKALESSLTSIGILYHNPMAHYTLAIALVRTRRWRQAIDALEVALSMNPHFAEAHAKLATLYSRRLLDEAKANEHRLLAREMRKQRRQATAAKRAYVSRPFIPSSESEETPPADAAGARKKHSPAARVVTKSNGEPIVIVSGLPRSGTSMVMQMLSAGGLPLLTDELRLADESNPRGYFEYEPVKRLRNDASWLPQACGKGVKIISHLLPYLPRGSSYRVLYIERDLDEVLASQRTMLERTHQSGAQLADEKLRQVFEAQVNRVFQWIAHQPHIDVLRLKHAEIIDNASGCAGRIKRFLGEKLDADKMAEAVDPRFYRSRAR